MANGFSDLLGQIASPFYEGRDLDEEERRLIEELRAQGAYVPQERKVSPFGYGSGRRRREDLTAMRAAIQPEQDRRMKELMWQREQANRLAQAKEANQLRNRAAASQQRFLMSPASVAARQAAAVEKFNLQQNFADQLTEKNRAKLIKEEQRRQFLGGLPKTSLTPVDAGERYDLYGHIEAPYRTREQYIAEAPPASTIEPAITDREEAELAVSQRNITPALTQLEALKQLQQKTETQAIDVETKRRADDLAKQVHINLPSDYAKKVADSQVLGLELKTLLDTHRLNVSQKVGESLMQTEADALMATKKQEIMAIESLESWLVNTEPGREFMRRGGPQREEQRLKLGALKAALMQAEAAKAGAWNSNFGFPGYPNNPNNPNTGSGYNFNRPTFNWPPSTNAPPVRRFP